MPFLSLGLLDHERRDAELRDAGATGILGLDASVKEEANAAKDFARGTKDQSAQSLPPKVEELRQKLSGKSVVKPAATSLAASVDSLSSAERYYVPTFGTFKFGYFPASGLLYSSIGHEVALLVLFLVFTYGLPFVRPQKMLVKLNPQDYLVYLPEVGGGSEGQKSPSSSQNPAAQTASAAPARASKGFAYPGQQAILSDPPHPTNAFQTVQRPLLVHPEPIRKLVPLPNIVQLAETRLPSDVIAPKAAQPKLVETPKPIKVRQDSSNHRKAKFDVPVNAPQIVAKAEMPKLPAAAQPLPEAPKVEPQPKQEDQLREVEKPSPKAIKVTAEKRAEEAKEVAPPSTAQIARLQLHGKAKEPLLSLSPMPLPHGSDTKVPNGEARGRFAIAPGGTLNPNSLNPGKPNGPISTSPGTGSDNSRAPNAATESASNNGTGDGHSSSAGGSANSSRASGRGASGGANGSGDLAANGTGGTGTGRGRGTEGNGAGKSGRGVGTGSGAGSGSGSGSFPGITIQGGEDSTAKNNDGPGFTIEPQSAYAMTVVSTASSGGGLEDFGVFADQRIFTVYIPMKRSPEEEDPTWTLQYGLLDDDSGSVSSDQQVSAPSPVMREWPQIPAELEKKYSHRQVVVYAVVDKEGKVSHIAVKQTPDRRLSDPILQALAKWVFRPAQLNGQPVAVKVLIGIPLV
jgi:TonB-like protein